MSRSVRFVSYRDKDTGAVKGRGFVVRGGPEVQPPRVDKHMGRAFWLLSKLEAANWGTVQNYDGAGMSAGPLHVIAVYPSTGGQGSLWRMVGRIFASSSTPAVNELRNKLAALGWRVSEDGVVRDSSGAAVRGGQIREQLSAANGIVPESGPVHERAKDWALAFHEVFSDPSSYPGQYESTIDWLFGNFDAEADAYRKYAPGVSGSDADVKSWLRNADMAQVGPYLDLAMSVYHAFSVNAPGKAKQVLNRVLARNLNVRDFAKALTKGLAEEPYGNWATRGRNIMVQVGRSGLWPEDVVKDVYPGARVASMVQYVKDGAPVAAGSFLALFTVFVLSGAAYRWYTTRA